MQSAKDSVKKVLSKSGQHDTTVHENVAPAVQHETVSPTQHDRVTTAVDREVHQDHYHTTEQPVQHQEILPEKHHHKEAAMEERSFEHGNQADVDRRLAEERAGYKSSSTRVDGEHTRSAEPTVAGEHVHHHVHENIQPVVHKQTVEPHVVHSTVPIHEVHHNEAQHHGAHSLPPVSMDEFKGQGGSLKGREERSDFFSGEPRAFDGNSVGHGQSGTTGTTGTSGMTGSHTGSNLTGTDASGIQRDQRDALDNRGTTGTTGMTGASDTTGTTGTTGSSGNFGTMEDTQHKPSMMDKLNPKKDTDGDGKAGIMK